LPKLSAFRRRRRARRLSVHAGNGSGATTAGLRILVDLEAEKAAHTPRRRLDEHPDERRTFEALEAHITTLKEAVAKAEALGEQHRQEAEMASKRVDHLVTELVEMSMRMAEQTAVADRVRAEFDAYRARPWWRRLARSAA
jgi:chromosome segregation ATPase